MVTAIYSPKESGWSRERTSMETAALKNGPALSLAAVLVSHLSDAATYRSPSQHLGARLPNRL